MKKEISITSKSFVDTKGDLYFDVSFLKDGITIEKRVDAETYLSLLKGNISDKESFLKVPKLPENIYAAWIGKLREDSFVSLSVYKAEKRAFAIAGEFFRLPFPTLLMYVKVEKGVRQELSIFALDTDEPNEDSELYHYPFGNVYESGNVCMGNIVSKNLTSILDTDRVFDDFICGVTNEHLYSMRNKLGLTQLELVKYIEEKENFPTELLMPVDRSIAQFQKSLNL